MSHRRRHTVKRTVLLEPEHAELCQWIGTLLYANGWPRINHSLVCNLICRVFMEFMLDNALTRRNPLLEEKAIRRTREWALGKRKLTQEEMKIIKKRLEELSQIGLLKPE